MSRIGVTIDGVWIRWLDLLTTYTHHSELQAINSAISQLHTSEFTVTPTSVLSLLQSPRSFFWQRILTQEL
jgi:hypothetical protein